MSDRLKQRKTASGTGGGRATSPQYDALPSTPGGGGGGGEGNLKGALRSGGPAASGGGLSVNGRRSPTGGRGKSPYRKVRSTSAPYCYEMDTSADEETREQRHGEAFDDELDHNRYSLTDWSLILLITAVSAALRFWAIWHPAGVVCASSRTTFVSVEGRC